MPQYCLVKHRISTYVIDGADADRNPDRVPVTGTVTFEALLDKGDSVVVTEGGVATTITLAAIEARITNGELWHRGEEGVKLFAGGPDTNPERIRYRAKFSNLIAGGKRIELKPILFEAVPGGELALSMAQPVPGKPYPGYSATIEDGIAQIEGALDEALGQVGGAVDVAIDTRLDVKADVSTVSDLAAVTTGVTGVARRNSSRIRELVSELATKADQVGVDAALAGKADTGTVDELSALVVSALGVGRRNADRIKQLAAGEANQSDLTEVLATKADTSTLDARVPTGGIPGQLLMATPTGGKWSWAGRFPSDYHDKY